jgi:poly-gamma-glutamate synthesis protein (capsule biosynthesis protein)
VIQNTPTPSITLVSKRNISVWIAPALPLQFSDSIILPPEMSRAEDPNLADLRIAPMSPGQGDKILEESKWVYVLAAPFPTTIDNISMDDLLNIWKGEEKGPGGQKILVSKDTYLLLSEVWGKADPEKVARVEVEELIGLAWKNENTWALIPFEQLQARWKVIQIDHISPLQKDVNIDTYPLTMHIGLIEPSTLKEASGVAPIIEGILPEGNFDPLKMTSVILTGTTAMVRYLALRMEEKGVLYPGRNIRDLLRRADITHISNEVSFDPNCPPAVPLRREARFCSDPKYIDLLKDVGADIIELTGNHNLDWGYSPYQFSLDLYQKEGLRYYGGGANSDEARKPLLIEHNGNKLAFLGCSPAGPENVWATTRLAGSAKCDFEYIQVQITQLIKNGYLPIFTFQHFEVDDFKPHSSQRVDFQKIARMGAVIVSGSQSHFAQGMTFIDGHFVHYGLGNLFFDQMFEINRPAFIDQHFFYNGRYIGTVLETTLLEDYAKPRNMSVKEREAFLDTVFGTCVW